MKDKLAKLAIGFGIGFGILVLFVYLVWQNARILPDGPRLGDIAGSDFSTASPTSIQLTTNATTTITNSMYTAESKRRFWCFDFAASTSAAVLSVREEVSFDGVNWYGSNPTPNFVSTGGTMTGILNWGTAANSTTSEMNIGFTTSPLQTLRCYAFFDVPARYVRLRAGVNSVGVTINSIVLLQQKSN